MGCDAVQSGRSLLEDTHLWTPRRETIKSYCFPPLSLKMEAEYSSETLVHKYKSSDRHSPEDHHWHFNLEFKMHHHAPWTVIFNKYKSHVESQMWGSLTWETSRDAVSMPQGSRCWRGTAVLLWLTSMWIRWMFHGLIAFNSHASWAHLKQIAGLIKVASEVPTKAIGSMWHSIIVFYVDSAAYRSIKVKFIALFNGTLSTSRCHIRKQITGMNLWITS